MEWKLVVLAAFVVLLLTPFVTLWHANWAARRGGPDRVRGWSERSICGFWGWHSAGNEVGFDGASATSRCWRCGLRVLQDSQGNWFPASRQDS